MAYGARSRDEIVRSYPRNIYPSTDDKPFFFFTDHFGNIFGSNPAEHPARRLAMPILYGTFSVFGLLCLITVFLPLYFTKDADIRTAPYRLRSLIYFSMLGIGYMLIEISLIQRLTVFLGHPTYSFVIVLAALLLSSGAGSLVSGWWCPEENRRKLITVLAGVVGLGLVIVLVAYDLFIDLMWLDKPQRFFIAVATIVPPGFLMGMCFPMGMQIVQRFHSHLVPWGWGVNGAASVFASALSLVLALNIGLKATLFTGVVCYMIGLGVIASLRKAG